MNWTILKMGTMFGYIKSCSMTKKDLLKAIENIPMDAQICSIKKMEFIKGYIDVIQPVVVKYDTKHNRIIITC